MHNIYPWQETQWQQLQARYKNNTLPHALLFIGPKGMGKLDFAQAFAEILLCINANNAPCNGCSACDLIKAGTHPDLLLIQPEATGKMIKIEQIRQLVDVMSKTAQQGHYQIAIIEPAEAMNNAAANALLKTLEEPAPRKIIILISHQPATLAATIRSRCQTIIFKPIHRDKTLHWLQQQTHSNETELLLSLAEQVPLQALKLAQPDCKQQHEEWLNYFNQLCLNKIDPVKLADIGKSAEIKIIITHLLMLLMDMLRLKFKVNDQFIINQNNIPLIDQLGHKISMENLLMLLNMINQINRLIARNLNLNQQLLLENLFINLQEKFKVE